MCSGPGAKGAVRLLFVIVAALPLPVVGDVGWNSDDVIGGLYLSQCCAINHRFRGELHGEFFG